jgi:uncharacterized membrane protein
MRYLLKAGRLLFAISIIGMAVQQLFYPQFRAIFVPQTPAWLPFPEIWVYFFSLYLIVSSIVIVKAKNTIISIMLGIILFLLFLTAHIPYRLSQQPNNLGVWTVAIKCLAFSGGAFIASGAAPVYRGKGLFRSSLNTVSEKLVPLGTVLFSGMLIAFGIDHFLYTTGVTRMVPQWIPYKIFWTYFAAIMLIGSGCAILLRVKTQLASVLAGIMILLWVFILHLPGAIATPEMGNSNALTATCHALGFSGIAFMIAGLFMEKPEALSYKKVFSSMQPPPASF